MSRVAVLVDAGYLFKAGGQLLNPGQDVRRDQLVLEPVAAMKLLTETGRTIATSELLRVYWYDAALENSRSEHREIAQQPHLKLRMGHLNSAGQQKGVDPLILMDMLTLSQNRACEEIVLLSGDADLIVGVLQAQERGVRVHLLGIAPSRANQALLLREEVDTCNEWGKDVVDGFLRMATPDEMKSRRPWREPVGVRARKEIERVEADKANKDAISLRIESTPSSAPRVAQVVTDAKSSVEMALFSTVVDAVVAQLDESARRAIRTSVRPGIVPGEVDHKLFGTAKKMLNTLLSEPEKRLLRQMLYERCCNLEAPSSES